MTEAQQVLAKRLRKQARSCAALGSELYAHLLNHAAEDVEAGGVILQAMESHAFAPSGDAVALKLMGAVHLIVLEGGAPALAAIYPSTGGNGSLDGAWPAFSEVVRTHLPRITELMDATVQTNEVGRSAALLEGFLEIARRTGKPLRLLEVGASAGLNLRWDHFRYEAPRRGWGDPSSPVVLRGSTEPLPEVPVEVAARRGCDPNPLDPTTPEGRLTLSSYVWPDQTWRWEQLRGALEVAALVPAIVERAQASDFLERELAAPANDVVTVVYHSIVIQYMAPAERDRVIDVVLDAGRRATEAAPVAWLRMEPPPRHFKWAEMDWDHWAGLFPDPTEEGDPLHDLAPVHLNLWPGGDTELIARAGYHGRPVHRLI